MDLNVHPRWTALLAWLGRHGMQTTPLVDARKRLGAGYGLVALQQVPPETPLFTIPATAMLNISTLSPHYPRPSRLTAIQLISLHLLIHRPRGSEDSPDPLFGPYISILPREFEYHPLTWLCDKLANSPGSSLLSRLPASVMNSLSSVAGRFRADCKAVFRYLRNSPSVLARLQSVAEEPITEMQYLWAWLIVNTRCVYHRVRESPSDPDNLTLCPILDFANHTTSNTRMFPGPRLDDARQIPWSKAGGDFTLSSPSGIQTEIGDELYLRYGAHANATLFVEYGFVTDISQAKIGSGEFSGELDVHTLLESLFEAKGTLGGYMRELLETEGYWGEWTLHTLPTPAHPSYRLITALRLCTLVPNCAVEIPHADRQIWRDTILGIRDRVSEANEEAWRSLLLKVCQQLAESAKAGLKCCGRASGDRRRWLDVAEGSVDQLWEEQLYVAEEIVKSILGRVEF